MEDIKINPRGFWETEDGSGHLHDQRLMRGLIKLCKNYKQKFLVDFGCGMGFYAKGFQQAGFSCDAYDGNPNTEELTGGIGKTLDLSEPQDFGIMYDMVLSLEVGEHIPVDYEGIFIQNLVVHAEKMIVLSWAVPGQAGLGHVNCRDNEYIIGKLKENGFRYDERWSGILRRSSLLPWFRKTLMVFHREEGQG
jgi:hypothetical protein